MSKPELADEQREPTRRDALKAGAATVAGGPFILNAQAANDPLKVGVIGLGSRGSYLLDRLAKLDTGRCTALCDESQQALDDAAKKLTSHPNKYKNYRDLLAERNVEAVMIAVPLHAHFGVTRDALEAGKHVFCENSLVFKAEEVHALKALAQQHSKQIVQVGLERRYSSYFQAVKKMIDDGILGNVTHIQAQWHRNPGWTMEPGGKDNPKNWRLFREYSGGLMAELGSHHVDVANWFFGAQPEFVVGVGGLDTWKDGREVFDNIQLIYSYPNGRKLVYSAMSTCRHLPILSSQRSECGLVIMGTGGAIELTFGSGGGWPTGLWFREPPANGSSEPQRGIPLKTPATEVDWKNDSFVAREAKLARGWLYDKGILFPQEGRDPVDSELESFLRDARTGSQPLADWQVGLAASTAVILSNIAMEGSRRVFFKEIETLGVAVPMPPPATQAPANFSPSTADEPR